MCFPTAFVHVLCTSTRLTRLVFSWQVINGQSVDSVTTGPCSIGGGGKASAWTYGGRRGGYIQHVGMIQLAV
jgi:hypothetical protein